MQLLKKILSGLKKKVKEMETAENENIIDAKEASEYLKIKRSTLYEYVKYGIPYIEQLCK